jgi:ribosomal protein L31E
MFEVRIWALKKLVRVPRATRAENNINIITKFLDEKAPASLIK